MKISAPCLTALRLSWVSGFGLKALYRLLESLGDFNDLAELNADQISELDVSPKLRSVVQGALRSDSDSFARYLGGVEAWLAGAPNRYLLCPSDASYPALLKEIYQPPPLLYLEGELSCLNRLALAIVGSRKASMAGLRHAQNFAEDLAAERLVVVSGLALGIDAAAHRGALAADGQTIAVLGTGLDFIYPQRHHSLAQQILDQQGLIISEMKLGTPAIPANFPRRNRIISGLSRGVLVVEASLKSGSLVTAKYALEQGREVFAVPANIEKPEAQGCHALIKQGAKLVESLEDIVQELGAYALGEHAVLAPDSGPRSSSHSSGQDALEPESQFLSADERRVLAVLAYEGSSFDQLMLQSGLAAPELNQALLMLEIKALALTVPGGYQRIK